MPMISSFPHCLADIDTSMAERIEAVDWSATALGPMAEWSSFLRNSLLMILAQPIPQILYWGEELICIHNRAYDQILAGREPALGRPLPQVWDEVWPELEPLIAATWEGSGHIHKHSRFLVTRQDRQQEQWYDFSFSPLMDESGAIQGILNTAIDRTDEVLYERDLEHLLEDTRGQRQFLETLLDRAPACIAVLQGRELRYSLINRLYQQLHPNEPMLGRCFGDVFPEAVAAGIDSILRQVLETGERHVARGYHFPTPDKPDALWDHEIIRLPDRSGEPTLLMLAWDTTDYHHLTQALQESEERFRTMANNMPQLAWMADAHGWVFWYNQRWYEYTGSALEAMQGWGWRSVHHPEHVERVAAHVQRSWDTGEPWEDLFPLRRHDGAYRWFLSRAEPIRDDGGQVVRWFGTNTDITEHLRTEEELRRRTEQLAVANSEMEAFSYSVSHDLRAPLRMIGISSELLECDHGAQLDADAREHLHHIQQAAKDMNQLISDMLQLSQIGRQDMQRQHCDLAVLADGILKRLHADEPERDMVIAVQHPLPAYCDAGLMQLALGNLLSNAWKFTAKREQGHIAVDARQENGETIYSVRDNGAGFSMTRAQKLFEPFQRLHSQSDFRGTGVGLAIVHRVIARHGGRIWAEAAEGEGACFYFTLG